MRFRKSQPEVSPKSSPEQHRRERSQREAIAADKPDGGRTGRA